MKIQLNESLKYFDKLILYLLHQKPPPKKYTPRKQKAHHLKMCTTLSNIATWQT